MPSRKFRSEGPILYGTYQFGYCEWAEWDGRGTLDELGELYAGGYLPYSAEPEDPSHRFYMARSLRVDPEGATLNKARRYDHRTWQAFMPQRQHLSKEAFLDKYGKEASLRAREWMEKRFGAAFISPERFDYILAKPFLQDVLIWRQDDRLAAFAFIVKGSWGAHYWYVFYANGTGSAHPPGHGYLVDFIHWAQENNLPAAYLGTVYGEKSRYKARGIGALQYWDGNAWNADRETLRRLQREDNA